ncbi:MAG TPA: glycosyltransferase family 4 protein [Terriglobales bacterium]|nr:glycosyltransferase family 4 protein [Terriglobales bacterium]
MGAPAARVAELSRLWTEAGHNVTVLTGFPNHPTGCVPAEYRSKLRRLIAREQLHGVNVVRSWLLPRPNREPLERIVNYASFSGSAAVTGTFLPRPDLVIATSPQLLVGLSGWWIARCKQVPFIFEVRDLWPESLAAVGASRENSIFYRTLSRIASFLYRRSDHVVVVSPAFRERLVEDWGLDEANISVVENGVDTDLFSPSAERPELRTALGAEGKFIVSYIGTIGMAHGMDTVMEAAEQLQRTSPQIIFVVVGEGSEKERTISNVRVRGLTNIRFLDQQAREDIPAFISASDLCLVPLRKSPVFNTVIPSKLLEFMACARPVVVGVGGLTRKIVEQANAGLAVEPENATELARAIRQMAANPDLGKEFGDNGRRYILQNFTRAQKARTYLDVMESLLESRRGYRAMPASITASR